MVRGLSQSGNLFQSILMEDIIMRTGIIGMGNMGSKYAEFIAKGQVKGMELAAITRVSDERWNNIKDYVSPQLMRFNSGDDM